MASISKWTVKNSVRRPSESGGGPQWPNETMVKAFSSGQYSTEFAGVEPGSRVLDIGCLYCNNLRFFAAKECELFGVEVNREMVGLATQAAQRLAIDVDVREGTNRNLPFEDKVFDIVLSVNTLHYEVGRTNVDRALREFCRILKNDTGRLFLMTAGPDHDIMQKSVRQSDLDYLLRDYDFRDGDRFAFFDDESHLQEVLSEHFNSVELGRLTERFPSASLDFRFAAASGPKF